MKTIFCIFLVISAMPILGINQTINASLPLDGILGPQAFKESDFVVKYCAEHASDNNNTVQDLVNNLTITWAWFNGETCETVKQFQNDFQHLLNLADEEEVQTVLNYCLAHASEVAQGKNVVLDLVKSGMVKSGFENYTCQDLKEEYEKGLELKNAVARAQTKAEAQKRDDFSWNCRYGNLSPSQYSECYDADNNWIDGPICLYNEKDFDMWYTESDWTSGRYHLTPEELSECKDKRFDGSGRWFYLDNDEDKDEDTKD